MGRFFFNGVVVPVSREKKETLKKQMERLKIYEEDLIEKFILGSGSGGQKVNKTSSCVYLKHLPTGIEIKCQKQRSREMNRFFARRELCEKISHQIYKEKTKKQYEREKIRRQKKQRALRLKRKILDDKKIHSKTKALRKKIEEE